MVAGGTSGDNAGLFLPVEPALAIGMWRSYWSVPQLLKKLPTERVRGCRICPWPWAREGEQDSRTNDYRDGSESRSARVRLAKSCASSRCVLPLTFQPGAAGAEDRDGPTVPQASWILRARSCERRKSDLEPQLNKEAVMGCEVGNRFANAAPSMSVGMSARFMH